MLHNVLQGLPAWRDALLFVLEHGLTLPSRAEVQERMQHSYLEILDQVQSMGRSVRDVRLLNGSPDVRKSDSVIAAQFAQVNKISASRFIAADQLQRLPPQAVLLIVDDLAHSGSQMTSWVSHLLSERPDVMVRSTTLLTTPEALQFMQTALGKQGQGGRYQHVVPPNGWLKNLRQAGLLNALLPDQQARVLSLMSGGFSLSAPG